MKPCDICDGSRKIRLPIRCEMSVVNTDDGAIDAGELSRIFPCPECGSYAPVDNLSVRREVVSFDASISAQALDAAKRGVAMRLADYLATNGYIVFEQRDLPSKIGDRQMVEIWGRVGVMAPDRVDTLEALVEERQFDVAEEVSIAAQDGISNWGSYFGWTSIAKSDACRAVREGVQRVRRARSLKLRRV